MLKRSVTFAKREYLIPDSHEDGSGAALEVVGDNLVVDFAGATLRGTPPTTEPDRRQGTGVRVRGKNITLKNLRVRGYKIGLLARNAPGLTVENSDFSYNWKQRLKSTREREDAADWMSFHHNEKDEWLRYGGGIYLRKCDGFTVRNCRVTGGQSGLLLTECDRGTVYNNDFSFLSALGIGMYRSSENQICHNRIDWCVRGYSHGVYNRGQDSAGILIYEQSHKNIFAYNSVTHGGDGFFLWAGQTTMDTGKGGCNDNLLYANDFSHAPTNGIEATFSRNTFANNLILECWHGIWGGFSYETKIIANTFGLNAQAIAIEHGQDHLIQGNTFHRDHTAIALWQNERVDPNWGYGKTRDTESRDYRITENEFSHLAITALSVRDTRAVILEGSNRFTSNARLIQTTGRTPGLVLPAEVATEPPGTPLPATMDSGGNALPGLDPSPGEYLKRFDVGWQPLLSPIHLKTLQRPLTPAEQRLALAAPYYTPPLKNGRNPFLRPGTLRGRRYILVEEWGPYDFKRPLLWPRDEADSPQRKHFEILGPEGSWKVRALSPGVQLSATSGKVPGELVATLPTEGTGTKLRIELEYNGKATTDYRGIVTPAGKPVAFSYEMFFAPIDWTVRWYTWEKDKSDPRTQPDAFAARLAGSPLATLKTDRLDYAGYGAFAPGVPASYFATVAVGTLEVAPGEYTLEFLTDDGLRVFLDGKPLITDAWKYQGPTTYSARVTLGGKHTLRVEHFQIDGYAALKATLKPQQ